MITNSMSDMNEQKKGLTETLYETLKMFYENDNRKFTYNELKEKEMIQALPKLEWMQFIKFKHEKEEIIKNLEYQMIRTYQITPKGKDFFREVENHMKDHGYSTFKDVKTYFKLSLHLDPIETYRKKLDSIEKKRKK